MSKGHKKQHTPYEAPDSLRSAQRAKIIDLIAWGELAPGNGDDLLENIYLDGTPVRNPDGSYNHKGVAVDASIGTPDQPPLQGFGGLERLVSVGVQIKHGKPITRTIADPKIDRLRITVAVGGLVKYEDNGDILPTSVTLDVTVGGRTYPITFSGKSMSAYSRDLVVDALPGAPFTVTVSRPTPDSTTSKLKNDTYWRSIVEIVDTKENYGECAVVGLTLDSDRFGGRIPKRSYLVKNTSMQIPSNYDPYRRSYGGVWDGRFKIGWTDNPAWCFYHLLTDKRYGLGGRVDPSYVDKWSLYEIGRYCDVMVDDGRGGQEPRMTCNAWLSEAEDAKKVLDKVASCFRGIAVWDGNAVRALQDRPHKPVALYGNANVVDGLFAYSGVPNKSIVTAAEVSWLDPGRGYEPEIAYYQDDDAIKRYGRNVAKVEAFGCTSPGQARRYGRWAVETSVRERRSVTFTVGREGLKHTPFDIIEIADNDYAGMQLFGRVAALDGRKVTLDRDVPEGDDLKFRYQTATEAKTLGVTAVDGQTLTLDHDPEGLQPGHPYALATDKVAPRLFRCISITEEEDDGGYTITAITHDPHKEAIVDQGAVFAEASGRATAHTVPSVFGATVEKDGDTIVLGWDSLTGFGELHYQVAVTRNNASYRSERTGTTRLVLANLAYGEYRAVIRACNSAGQVSEPAEAAWSIDLEVTGLRATPRVFACYLSWQLPQLVLSQAKTEIWHSDSDDIGTATRLAGVSYPNDHYLATGLGINDVRYYWARMVDSFGNAGPWTESVKGQAIDDPDPIIEQIQGSITKTVLHKELASYIDGTASDLKDLDKEVDAEVERIDEELGAARSGIAEVRKEAKDGREVLRGDVVTLRSDSEKADKTLQGHIDTEAYSRRSGDKAERSHTDAQIARVDKATRGVDGRVTAVSQDVVTLRSDSEKEDAALAAQIREVKKVSDKTKKGADALYSLSVIGTTQDGTPIVGGLSIGIDGKKASSEVLIQADKFMLLDSKNKQPMFSVVDGKAALNGDLIASGTIVGQHIAANQTLESPKIEGGTITGAAITSDRITATNRVDTPLVSDRTNRHLHLQANVYLWRFDKNDGNIYGPHGRYVTAQENLPYVKNDVGALTIGSFLIYDRGNTSINQILNNPLYNPRDDVSKRAPGSWKVLSFSDSRDFSILQRIR